MTSRKLPYSTQLLSGWSGTWIWINHATRINCLWSDSTPKGRREVVPKLGYTNYLGKIYHNTPSCHTHTHFLLLTLPGSTQQIMIQCITAGSSNIHFLKQMPRVIWTKLVLRKTFGTSIWLTGFLASTPLCYLNLVYVLRLFYLIRRSSIHRLSLGTLVLDVGNAGERKAWFPTWRCSWLSYIHRNATPLHFCALVSECALET